MDFYAINNENITEENWLSKKKRIVRNKYIRRFNRDILAGKVYYETIDDVEQPVLAIKYFFRQWGPYPWQVNYYIVAEKRSYDVRGWTEEQINEFFDAN